MPGQPSLSDLLASGDLLTMSPPSAMTNPEVQSLGYRNPSTGEQFYLPKPRTRQELPPLNFGQLIRLAQTARTPEAYQVLRGFLPGLPEYVDPQLARTAGREAAASERRKEVQTARKSMWVMQNLGSFINKQTGDLATELETVPDLEDIEKNYVKLSSKQLENVQALRGFDNQLAEYINVIPRLNLPEPGLAVLGKGAEIKTKRLLGDPAVAHLDSIKAQITQLARAFGGDARVSDQEMARLESGVVKDFSSVDSAIESMRVLKSFRETRAKAIGIPGLMRDKGQAMIGERKRLKSGKMAVFTSEGWKGVE